MGSVSLDLVFCLFVCFFFSTLEHFDAVLQKLMRMVRSIKSDDAEDWCKEADFKFKMLRAQNKNKQYYCCFLF